VDLKGGDLAPERRFHGPESLESKVDLPPPWRDQTVKTLGTQYKTPRAGFQHDFYGPRAAIHKGFLLVKEL